MNKEPDRLQCTHCLANIRNRYTNGKASIPMQLGVCTKCLKSRAEYKGIIKELNKSRQQNYYQTHREEEKARQRAYYRQNKLECCQISEETP